MAPIPVPSGDPQSAGSSGGMTVSSKYFVPPTLTVRGITVLSMTWPPRVTVRAASCSVPCWRMVTLPVAEGTAKVTVSPTAWVPSSSTCAVGSALGWGVSRRQIPESPTKTVAVPWLDRSTLLAATTW